ncbi:MAG TPA: ferritin [Pseudonocardia sp.]|jgi:ferritin|uniref:ferritin n=1 Tax=Pseudonocardia sp. TaxID=60912 RepID=UPI002F406C2C
MPKFPQLLLDQVRSEFTAAQQYTAIAVWLDGEDLPRLAARFYAQATEERNHAMIMVRYLLDKDLPVAIPGISEVRNDFGAVHDAVELSLTQEKQVTDQIITLARTARDEGDYVGEQFMQWFLKEQVEEVSSMSTLLRVVDRAGENLFHIEDFIARELTQTAPKDPTAPPTAG